MSVPDFTMLSAKPVLARHIDIVDGQVGEPFVICVDCFENRLSDLALNCPELQIFKIKELESGECSECERDERIQTARKPIKVLIELSIPRYLGENYTRISQNVLEHVENEND